MVKGGPGLPGITGLIRDGHRLTAKVTQASSIAVVELYYQSNGTWQSVPASFDAGCGIAEALIPQEAEAYFLRLTDLAGLSACSGLQSFSNKEEHHRGE
jgi:hypothetical protein